MKKAWLFFTVFCCGFVVMIIEIAGARLIHPYFGVGIYVWAALISITLGGLALGYWIGGLIADKFPKWKSFYLIIFLSAIPITFIPVLYKELSLRIAESVGIAFGALITSFILFGLPLFLLGFVSPYAIKMASDEHSKLGKTAGRLYGVSTLGSLSGTLFTAFVLIPNLSVTKSFFIAAIILTVVSILGWIIANSKKLLPISLLSLFLIPFCMYSCKESYRSNVLHHSSSIYGDIKIVESEYERFFTINGFVQSHFTLDKTLKGGIRVDCEYITTFSWMNEFNWDAKTGLLIGYGAGSIPIMYEDYQYETRFDVVELDSSIIDIAYKYFRKPENIDNIFIEDGRTYIRKCQKKYDIVAVDVIDSDAIPINMFSKEFFEEVRNILPEDGVVAINSILSISGEEVHAIANTMNSVFQHTRAWYAHKDAENDLSNVIFFASDNKIEFTDEVLEEDMKEWEVVFEESDTILTDEHNILEQQCSGLAIKLRELYLENLYEELR